MAFKAQRNILQPDSRLATIDEASTLASELLGREVSSDTIEQMIKHRRLHPVVLDSEQQIDESELKEYLSSRRYRREELFKERVGDDLLWHLSFDQYSESDTTKHVHRIHPYKGKYIPQLVEYLLDSNIDDHKRHASFHPGCVVLDPFCGSGTTMVQANELGLHCIGVDVSDFNCVISNAKVSQVDLSEFHRLTQDVEEAIANCEESKRAIEVDQEISQRLSNLNAKYFPKPEFPSKVRNDEVNAEEYSQRHLSEFLSFYKAQMESLRIETTGNLVNTPFLQMWFPNSIHHEITAALNVMRRIEASAERNLLQIVLSRAVRSSRATKHYDLATLVEPNFLPYYCKKHYKICKPLVSMLGWWRRYAKDTLRRVGEFDTLRTETDQVCLHGDSRSINIFKELDSQQLGLAEKVRNQGIAGIVSSPPYVGIIDYHEQHAYSYELFGLERSDQKEIGPLYNGSGKKARSEYVAGIAAVLNNCRQFLIEDFNIYLVANDKFNLYPAIAEKTQLTICNELKRPVLNRAEGNKGFYSEAIFHMKAAGNGH